ncbi:hypothetical protein KFK09_001154 [Dendrobium nobile]|uniref:Uncharacterized protein n=1 Tax=Dendrobium nobile TaxID=94219 RepID=A0A8T3CA16_DENNO|nr:hypothetical protein KFK09_001154 [Dendrobium nobile]
MLANVAFEENLKRGIATASFFGVTKRPSSVKFRKASFEKRFKSGLAVHTTTVSVGETMSCMPTKKPSLSP